MRCTTRLAALRRGQRRKSIGRFRRQRPLIQAIVRRRFTPLLVSRYPLRRRGQPGHGCQ
jgi:hypothetical protein